MTDRAGMILWYDAPHVLYLHTRLGIPSTLSGRRASLLFEAVCRIVCLCMCRESGWSVSLRHQTGLFQGIPSSRTGYTLDRSRLVFPVFLLLLFSSPSSCMDGWIEAAGGGWWRFTSLSLFLFYKTDISVLLLCFCLYFHLSFWPEWNWLVTEASIYTTTIRHTPPYSVYYHHNILTDSPFSLFFCCWKFSIPEENK